MGAERLIKKTMMNKEFLLSAIHDYENGGLGNEDFLKKAHAIYNEYATYSCSLPDAENPYLLGIVFSAFAKYYAENIDYYASIMENALFCFGKVMKTSESVSERQCAAIRMLLLIDENDWVMKGIVHKFFEQRNFELYRQPLLVQKISAQGMAPWTYEVDILTHIGNYCINESRSCGTQSSISSEEMARFNSIRKGDKYHVRWPLVRVPIKQVFDLFQDFISDYVNTPYERRVTQLRYGW